MCGSFGCGGAGSYFSPPALRGVDVCCTSSWISFCASSCGSCGFPRRVLPQVPFGGYSIFLAQVACPAPAVELCLWGLRYLSCGAWFCLVPCSSSGSCGLCSFPCRRFPLGVSTLSANVCLSYCCAGGVSWAATLPWCSPGFSYTGRLAMVRWVLHPVSGCSLCGCVCSCSDWVVVPCGSPCL